MYSSQSNIRAAQKHAGYDRAGVSSSLAFPGILASRAQRGERLQSAIASMMIALIGFWAFAAPALHSDWIIKPDRQVIKIYPREY
jgi:hypothetical protein